jgi:hypothetical protein
MHEAAPFNETTVKRALTRALRLEQNMTAVSALFGKNYVP